MTTSAAVQNRLKSEYNRALKEMRKQYAEEVALIRAREEQERRRAEEKLRKEKTERDRIKMEKKIDTARRELRRRQEREEEWKEKLRQTQIRREARKERFHKARLLILQELEDEAKHWVATTPEEVEQVFGPRNELLVSQQLWTRPHSRIGVAPEDATFWRYQSDTWTMSRTYLTPKEYLFQGLLETADYQANLDEITYWTPEKVSQQTMKENRARLRALVEKQTLLLIVQRQLHRENLGAATNASSNPNRRKLFIAQIPKHHSHSLQYGRRKYQHVPPDHPLRFFLAKQQQHPITYDEVECQVALEKDNFSKFFTLHDEEEVLPGSDGMPQFQIRPHQSWPLLLGKEEERNRSLEKEKIREKKEEQSLWAQMGGMEAADAEPDVKSEEENEYLTSAIKTESEEDEDLNSLIPDPILKEFAQGPDEWKVNEKDVDWMITKLEKQIMLLEDDMQGFMKSQKTDTKESELSNWKKSDSHYYTEAMEIVEGLTAEQQDAICSLDDVDFKGESDIPRLIELLRSVPGLLEHQIHAIVKVEMEHLKSADDITGLNNP